MWRSSQVPGAGGGDVVLPARVPGQLGLPWPPALLTPFPCSVQGARCPGSLPSLSASASPLASLPVDAAALSPSLNKHPKWPQRGARPPVPLPHTPLGAGLKGRLGSLLLAAPCPSPPCPRLRLPRTALEDPPAGPKPTAVSAVPSAAPLLPRHHSRNPPALSPPGRESAPSHCSSSGSCPGPQVSPDLPRTQCPTGAVTAKHAPRAHCVSLLIPQSTCLPFGLL